MMPPELPECRQPPGDPLQYRQIPRKHPDYRIMVGPNYNGVCHDRWQAYLEALAASAITAAARARRIKESTAVKFYLGVNGHQGHLTTDLVGQKASTEQQEQLCSELDPHPDPQGLLYYHASQCWISFCNSHTAPNSTNERRVAIRPELSLDTNETTLEQTFRPIFRRVYIDIAQDQWAHAAAIKAGANHSVRPHVGKETVWASI